MRKSNRQIFQETTKYQGEYFQQLSECLDSGDIVLGGEKSTKTIWVIAENMDMASDKAHRLARLLDCTVAGTLETGNSNTFPLCVKYTDLNEMNVYYAESYRDIIKAHPPIILCSSDVRNQAYEKIKEDIVDQYSKMANSIMVFTSSNTNGNEKWYKTYNEMMNDANSLTMMYFSIIPDPQVLKEDGTYRSTVINEYSIPVSNIQSLEPLSEAKTMIEFDKDKNMIINHNIDLVKEYRDTHRLVMLYLKDNNQEGLKFEAAKLHYMNHLVDKKLNSRITMLSKYNKSTYTRLRTDIINDFTRCIKALPDDFNFGEYYTTTPFNHYNTIVSDDTVKGVTHLVKQMLQ